MLTAGEKGGFMEPFKLPGTAPVLYFNHNHNNSISKKNVRKQVH